MNLLRDVVRLLVDDRMNRIILISRRLLDQGVPAKYLKGVVKGEWIICNISEPYRNIVTSEKLLIKLYWVV